MNTDRKEGERSGAVAVTQLLVRFRLGDKDAESRLLAVVYRELRQKALYCLNRERRDHTLQPTALVHEAFLRLTTGDQPEWQDRVHFLAVAARLMRQVLVDYARQHQARKRGGSREKIPLGEELVVSRDRPQQLLALDEALIRLARQDERQSRIVEMKFFGGLSIEEIADDLQVSARTVKREWTMARAWLHQEITR